MIELTSAQSQTLKPWFLPDFPGVAPGLHVIQTGMGTCLVDRWPNPQAALFNAGGNYSLLGDPAALTAVDLQTHITGFVETTDTFVPLLQAAFPKMLTWGRLIHSLDKYPNFKQTTQPAIRLLTEPDVDQVRHLSGEARWIWKTWQNSATFVSSGYVWGAFDKGRLVAVACTCFVGIHYEEIGVVTESTHRGMGYSTACAGKLCQAIQSRGRIPSWTTSADNIGSLRVAAKLGFTLKRQTPHYVVGIKIPDSPSRSSG